jgi:arylsulfatase
MDERICRITNHITQSEPLNQQLREAGYTTVGITANPWTATHTNFDKGFDEFYEVGRSRGEFHDAFKGTSLSTPARLFDMWYNNDRGFTHWRTFYDTIEEVIDSHDEPLFLWTFLLDCHNLCLAPRASREESSTLGMYSSVYRANNVLSQSDGLFRLNDSLSEHTRDELQAAYRDAVRSIDAFIERFVSDIPDDSVLLFHADHGEAFGEHGTMGHQSVLHEENIHVPLLVHGTDSDQTVDRPVSLSQIPSIIQSAALEDSFDPLAPTSDHAVSKSLDDGAIAVRTARWKYIDGETDEQLFNLPVDPDEQTDVSAENPTVLVKFRERVRQFYDSYDSADPSFDVTETEQLKEHLQSLGYK